VNTAFRVRIIWRIREAAFGRALRKIQTIRNTEKEAVVERPLRRHRSKAERRQIAEESRQAGQF